MAFKPGDVVKLKSGDGPDVVVADVEGNAFFGVFVEATDGGWDFRETGEMSAAAFDLIAKGHPAGNEAGEVPTAAAAPDAADPRCAQSGPGELESFLRDAAVRLIRGFLARYGVGK